VSTRDLAALVAEAGFTVNRNQIALNAPIKMIGMHKVPVALHAEVEVAVTVNVARSADEAERQARGENVTIRREGGDDEDETEAPDTFFDDQTATEKDADGDQGKGEEKPA
jgi:large subunit ribosomal protein L9